MTPSGAGAARASGTRRDGWTPGSSLVTRDDETNDDVGGPRIGVLALQGDVLEHLRALRRCGAVAEQVRDTADLEGVAGLVLPGGESTTIGRLLDRFGLLDALRGRVADGLPVFGTCAGMILLSDELDQQTEQPRVGGIAIRTRRNAFGRQSASFDTRLDIAGIEGGPMEVSFIRAPWVEQVLSDDVEVLAAIDGHPVVVAQDNLLASAFHPEITGDDRLHRRFVELVDRVGGAPRAAGGER